MRVAMGVLGFGALFGGLIQIPGVDHVLDDASSTAPSRARRSTTIVPSDRPTPGSGWRSAALISIAGIGLAYYCYIADPGVTVRLAERFARPAPLPAQQVVLRRAHRRARLPADDRARALRERGVRAGRRSTASSPTATGAVARRRLGRPRRPVRASCAPTRCCCIGGFAALGLYFLVVAQLMLSVLLWTPLVAAVLLLALPAPRAAAGSPCSARWSTLGLAIGLAADFDPAPPACSTSIDETWIPDLGVRYQLGVDGISVFLVLLTARAVVRGDAVVGASQRPGRRALAPLLLPLRARRDRRPRRLPGPGPAALRPLLRPDAGPVLLPDRGLRRREPDRGDDEDDRLHAGRLAADAGRARSRPRSSPRTRSASSPSRSRCCASTCCRAAARSGSSASSPPPSW